MFLNQYKWSLVGIGLIALLIAGAVWYQSQMDQSDAYSDEVHVHSDILVYVGDERLRFTDEKYQSRFENILHPGFHFHDGNDDVIHRHAANLTIAEFFASLGFVLTNDCLTTDDDRQFCSDENKQLTLFVNGEPQEDIASYVPEDEDRILLYYGAENNPDLSTFLDSVSDRACIYSYNCPERGTPPPEECGLTCEL